MKNNTFSLLSGNWNIEDNYASSLYPFLFQLINGNNSYVENALSETKLYFYNSTGQSFEDRTEIKNEKTVALIKIHHPIFKYDQSCGPKGTQTIMQILENYKLDTSIAGVVLDFNTGGGQASGNSEFAEYVFNFNKVKPLYSYTNGFLCSAGYYMASSSAKIVVNKHADFIGSIGTMYKNINLEGILIKKGAVINDLYSTKSKRKNIASRKLKEGDEGLLIKTILDPHRDVFAADIESYRPNINAEVLEGDVYRPDQAVALGLADQIGTLEETINLVFEASRQNKTISKNKNMTKVKFTPLNEILGVEELASNGNGTYLNDEQLQTITNYITSSAKNIKEAQDAQQIYKENLQTATDANVTVHAALTALLIANEVEGAEGMTAEEGITALSELITEYGGKDGAGKTIVPAGTEGEETNENIVGGVNIADMMNN